MNDYENRKQARIDRYRELAGKAQQESQSLYQQSHNLVKDIPLGQPLRPVGRRVVARSGDKMSQSVDAQKKAQYYAGKALAAERNKAISSDDPEAVNKLKEKLAGLEEKQTWMKKINAYYRKHQTCHGCEGVTNERATQLEASMENAHSWETAPYPPYTLQGNNQEISRLKKRIEQLEQTREVGFCGWAFEGGQVEINAERNRLQVFFDEIPDEQTRRDMKSGGFHWARSEGAWQRQLTQNAIYAARRIEAIRPADGSDPLRLQPKRDKPNPER